MFTKAIVRKPGENFSEGITTASLGSPNFKKALKQHQAYCNALTKCGVEVMVLDADLTYPDGCFVEDTAIVTEEMAVITRPGNSARLGEQESIAEILVNYKKLEYIFDKGTLDGGDIMRVGTHFYIGLSERTNAEGAAQLAEILAKYGFTSSEIPLKNGLHLKSGVTHLSGNQFIATPDFVPFFKDKDLIEVTEEESYIANCLFVNGYLLVSKGFPKTAKTIENLGYKIIPLDMSEFRKMDGSLTCLSLLL